MITCNLVIWNKLVNNKNFYKMSSLFYYCIYQDYQDTWLNRVDLFCSDGTLNKRSGWTTVKSCKISLELAYIITLFTLISLGGIHGGYSVHRRLKCTPEDKDMKYLGIILYIGGHGVWGGYTVCLRLWCIKCVILYSVQRGYS